MYTTETVGATLQWLAHGGPWRSEMSPEPGMPSAATNPAHSGGALAVQVDVERAWLALAEEDFMLAESVWLREGRELLYIEVGERLACSDKTAAAWHELGMAKLVAYANQGARPRSEWTQSDPQLNVGRPPDRRTASLMAGYPWVDPIVVDDSLTWGPQCPTCHLTTPVSGPCSC